MNEVPCIRRLAIAIDSYGSTRAPGMWPAPTHMYTRAHALRGVYLSSRGDDPNTTASNQQSSKHFKKALAYCIMQYTQTTS